MWYEEIDLYDFNNPGFSSDTGHFTQLVWKSTTDVGCGLSISGSNKIYAVSHYSPPGNFRGEYTENVSPISSSEPEIESFQQNNDENVNLNNHKTDLDNKGIDNDIDDDDEDLSISDIRECQKDYQSACLHSHNLYRELHHSPPLKTNKKLQNMAQKHAKYLSKKNELKHSKNRKNIGENIAYWRSSKNNSLNDCGGIKLFKRVKFF